MVTCSRCSQLFAESTGERLDSGDLLCPACQPLYAAEQGSTTPTAVEAAPATDGTDASGVFAASKAPLVGQQPQATPPPAATGEESWWSRTSRELWWLALLISYFMGLPLVQVVTKALDPGKLGPEEAVQLADTFVATAPLVIALAASIWLWLTYPTPGAAAFSGLIFLAVTSIGNDAALGSGTVTPKPVDGGGPLHHTLSYLNGYLQVYGPALFASGGAMGIYAGVKAHETAKEAS